MSDQFVAEIRIFGFNFAPLGWALCAGQLMAISQNTALFSLLGTTYGGDGKSTFALPDLQGNVPVHPGQGPGLSLYDLGEETGSESVILQQSEIPSHSHGLQAKATPPPAVAPSPGPSEIFGRANGGTPYVAVTPAHLGALNANAIAVQGGNQPHNNLMPYLVVNFCIALQGIFPPRG
jgi:microcystin-dependent protein